VDRPRRRTSGAGEIGGQRLDLQSVDADDAEAFVDEIVASV